MAVETNGGLGRRRPDLTGNVVVPNDVERGDYWRDANGQWWCYPPKGPAGVLSGHTVIEHEDGTITVSPSILMPERWHGYLTRGFWTEC